MSTLKGMNLWGAQVAFGKSVHDIIKENNNIIESDKLIELDKIGKKYDELYLDEKSADIHFLCGPELKRIPAHKNVLCEASDVFRIMFYGSMAQEGDIKLPETSSEAFKNLLKCCYFKLHVWNELFRDINAEVAAEAMFLGEMYMVPLCVVTCFNAWLYSFGFPDIKSVATLDQVFTIYNFTLLLEGDNLLFQNQLESSLCFHTRIILKKSKFINCSYYALDHFLQLEHLSEYESKIFRFCLEWAREACKKNSEDPNDLKNVRHQLKNLVYRIRYGAMTMAEFEEQIPKSQMSNLFPDPAECDDIVQLLVGSKVSKTGHFIVKPRQPWCRKFRREIGYSYK